MRPHPDAPTPARRAAAPGAPAGSRGQVPGQVGSDDRGGPWEGNGGRPEQDCAKSRMVARGSFPPFGGSVVRFLTPRTRQAAQVQGPAVTRCLALQPPPSESRRRLRPPQVPGRRAQSRPGARKLPGTASPKAANQLCLRCSVQPIVPTPGGRRASRGGACEELSYPAAPPAPLGAGDGGDLGPPRRVRALGEPLWDRSVGLRSPPSFQTCMARSISPPCPDRFWYPV